MKQLLFIALCLLTFSAATQTIEKSQSIVIYDTVPTTAPCTYCSERAFVRADSTDYWWDGDSWEKWNTGGSYRTTLFQDSILIHYLFGSEMGRDTVRVFGSGGGGATVTILPADSITVAPIAALPATTNAQNGLEEAGTNINALAILIQDLTTLSGMPATSTDLGTFTGVTIPDASDTKESLQALETALEAVSGGSDVTSSDALNATILANIALYGIAPVYSTSGGVFTEASTTDNTTLHQFYVKGASGSPTILGAGTVSITATFSYTVGATYYLTDTGTLATSADNDGDAIDYISAAVYCVQSLGGNDYILNIKDPVHFVNN